MALMPFTPPQNAGAPPLDPSQAQTVQAMMKVIFAAFALCHGIVSAMGIFWLVYFNRKTARAAFSGAVSEIAVENTHIIQLKPESSCRPVLITVIAVLNLIGAVFLSMSMLLPIPAMVFGFILYGWAKMATYAAYCCLQGAIGIGLWRMREWGRRLTLAVVALGAVQGVISAFRPSLLAQYSAEVAKIVSPVPSPLPANFQGILLSSSFGLSVLFCIAIAAVMIYYRDPFQFAPSPSGDAASA